MNNEHNISDIRRALLFAIEHHDGTYRKFSGLPYIYHPIAVAKLVREYKKSKHIKELVIACLCHDLVEDTSVTIDMIQELFGELVASIVMELTSDPEMIRKMGKTKYLKEKVLNMSSYALVAKLADRLHNCSDLEHGSESFVRSYTKETRIIIDGLSERNLSQTHIAFIEEIDNKISPFE